MCQGHLSVVDSLLAPRDMVIVFKAKSDTVEVNKQVNFSLSQKQVIDLSLLHCVRLNRLHVNGHTITFHPHPKKTVTVKTGQAYPPRFY